MMTPYTSNEDTAKTYKIATLISDNTQVSLNGITAQAISAKTNDVSGASMKTARSAPAGITTSFTTYFNASATVCNKPNTPTTFGPRRICTAAQTLRSPYTRNSKLIITKATMAKTCATMIRAIPPVVLKKSAIGPHTIGIPFRAQLSATTSASSVLNPCGIASDTV